MHVQILTQRAVKIMLTSLICYITNVGGNIQFGGLVPPCTTDYQIIGGGCQNLCPCQCGFTCGIAMSGYPVSKAWRWIVLISWILHYFYTQCNATGYYYLLSLVTFNINCSPILQKYGAFFKTLMRQGRMTQSNISNNIYIHRFKINTLIQFWNTILLLSNQSHRMLNLWWLHWLTHIIFTILTPFLGSWMRERSVMFIKGFSPFAFLYLSNLYPVLE